MFCTTVLKTPSLIVARRARRCSCESELNGTEMKVRFYCTNEPNWKASSFPAELTNPQRKKSSVELAGFTSTIEEIDFEPVCSYHLSIYWDLEVENFQYATEG